MLQPFLYAGFSMRLSPRSPMRPYARLPARPPARSTTYVPARPCTRIPAYPLPARPRSFPCGRTNRLPPMSAIGQSQAGPQAASRYASRAAAFLPRNFVHRRLRAHRRYPLSAFPILPASPKLRGGAFFQANALPVNRSRNIFSKSTGAYSV